MLDRLNFRLGSREPITARWKMDTFEISLNNNRGLKVEDSDEESWLNTAEREEGGDEGGTAEPRRFSDPFRWAGSSASSWPRGFSARTRLTRTKC